MAGRDQELCREVALLGQLGVVERLVLRLEIGAAVLPVGVEKQRVETPVEIVVVRNVAPRARTRIELLQAPTQIAQQPLRPRPARWPAADAAVAENGKQVCDRALLDPQVAVHIGLAELELGIEQDGALGGLAGEADRDRRTAAVAERKSGAFRARQL